MEAHNWRCAWCNQIISSFGIVSLTLAVRTHELTQHARRSAIGVGEVERAPNYWKTPNIGPQPQYTEPYGCSSGQPTYEESLWLRQQFILWDGDVRTAADLAGRYKEHA